MGTCIYKLFCLEARKLHILSIEVCNSLVYSWKKVYINMSLQMHSFRDTGQLRISRKLVKITYSFLNRQNFKVRVLRDRYFSDRLLEAGILQATVLLYSLYTSDTPQEN